MKIKCIILDDEPLAREGLKDYVEEVDFLELVGEFKNALEANSFLKTNKVDLMLTDINMPKMTGLEFVQNLEEPPLVIFTTAYREFAADSYELNGFDYLVKPIPFDRFLKTVNRAFDHLSSKSVTRDDHFFIKVDGKITKVLFEDILFIEGMKDYAKIHIGHESLMALISLKQIQSQLPNSEFIRVHRSFIVAKNKVDSIEGNIIHIGSHQVSIAPNLRNEVMEKILGDKLWKRG